jgi:hypothetical protein
VHDKAEVGLVVAHPQCACRDDGLQLVGQEPVLDVDASLGLDLAAVGLGGDVVRGQPLGDEVGVALGQGVDDPRAAEPRQPSGQPREPVGAAGEIDDLQPQALAAERSAVGPELARVPDRELLLHVGHHPIVGRRRRAQHRHAHR